VAAFRAESNSDWAALSELIEELRPQSRQHLYWLTYFRAQLAKQAGEDAQARTGYAFLAENPFFSRGYLAAINYLYPSETDPTEAYQRLLDAVETNPYDAALLRAYVLAALRANLETYAEDGLNDYRALLSAADFNVFQQEYERVRASVIVDF
jgi:hypothetical protein